MVVHFFKAEINSKEKNLGRLLMRFLELYGRKVNYNVVGLKVKDGLFVKKRELMINMENGHDLRHAPSLLCIEDPLDERNNVSKNSYKFDKIRDAFAYAYDMLDRVVGPTQVITGKSLTILGRIIRITDEVIISRENLFLSYRNYNFHLFSTFGQYIPFQQGRGGFRPNRGNRGNKRNNPNRNNYPSNIQKGVGHPSNENNGQQFNRNPNHRYNEFNGRGRNGKRIDGPNGHHYWNNHPKFNHFHQNSICYYSFDRNPNQQKVRALQLTEEKINDKVRDKSEANGSTAVAQESDDSPQRARSSTVPQ